MYFSVVVFPVTAISDQDISQEQKSLFFRNHRTSFSGKLVSLKGAHTLKEETPSPATIHWKGCYSGLKTAILLLSPCLFAP